MDNTVFNKRLKIGAIVFVSVVAVLLIVWFCTKNGGTTFNDCDCINEKNYAEIMDLNDAIKMLYMYDEIPESPANYKNYNESISGKYNREPFAYRAIDNYRLFLSEKAERSKSVV